MGKYVIESKFENTRCFLEVACENREPYFFINRVDSLTPYTELEPHAEVTADAYQRGYEAGLNDAWEAARKICTNWVLPDSVLSEIFGMGKTIDDIMKENTASEAIKKIRQYEQRQEEQIQVGDEVIYNGTITCVVFSPENDKRYASIIDADGIKYSADHRELTKTGRHFPEIAEVLAKMKETNNG